MKRKTGVYVGEEFESYYFGTDHPFGPDRFPAFTQEFFRRKLNERTKVFSPVLGTEEQLEIFQTNKYIKFVKTLSKQGYGDLDRGGDTPVMKGIFEAALYVTGSVIDASERIMSGQIRNAFLPVGGLHHARRDRAAGFCVFNDIGIVVERLKKYHGLKRIAYIDIDAHHGDGVYYEYEDDPSLIIADIHEDGRSLYPGTGFETEIGTGNSIGKKMNFPMPAKSDDRAFQKKWHAAEEFIRESKPEFIILQCGADSLKGDPLTHMSLTEKSHGMAAKSLKSIADQYCEGRMLALGGGGYNLSNIARAWNSVVENMI